jgi:nucleoside phosphorylase
LSFEYNLHIPENVSMPSVDFAILTGLTEEFHVLERLFLEFGIPKLRREADNADIWYRTRVMAASGRTYEIAVGFQDDMGPPQAQYLAGKVIQRWDPAYIILVGIAGSFNTTITFGDVIVSQQVFYYDPGKATGGSIEYRPEGYPCSIILIRQLHALVQDRELMTAWRRSAKESAKELARSVKPLPPKQRGRKSLDAVAARRELKNHVPNVWSGTVASGSLVIDDKKKQKELLRLHGKIIGTEMEGAGMMFATFREENPPAAIVIKGISDAADGNKAKADAKNYWRELAKENPVRLALEMIRLGGIRSLRADRFSLDITLASAAQAMQILEKKSVGTSPLAFPRLVVPEGPLNELRITCEPRDAAGPLNVLSAAVTFVDRDDIPQRVKLERGQMTWDCRQSLSASPVGWYALVDGEPSSVKFTVENAYGSLTEIWRPDRRK